MDLQSLNIDYTNLWTSILDSENILYKVLIYSVSKRKSVTRIVTCIEEENVVLDGIGFHLIFNVVNLIRSGGEPWSNEKQK